MPDHYKLLKMKIQKKIRFNAPHYSDAHLKRRLATRMRSLRITTYKEYAEYLDKDKKEYERLKSALTVNVTEFFRNPETYYAVKNQVLPKIFSMGKKNIRIWSAGCSDGKEPYSIAILIREYLKKKNNNFFIRIIATDIDEEMLEKGRKGWYSDEEMKGEIKKYLNYFEKENGGYRVKPEIRNLVIFKKHDLLSDKMPSCIDMIFCRNVAIYFTRETKEKLYLDFYNALNKGGYFVTGKTEMLIGEARQLFVPVNNSERIYLKL